MEIPDHLTCLLRNLYAGQEATVRTGHGTMDWFQIGEGVDEGYILSPAYLTYMQSTSCEMLDWKKHKLESRLPGESHGRRSLVSYSPRGRKEWDVTERFHLTSPWRPLDFLLTCLGNDSLSLLWFHTVKGFSVVNEAEVDIFLEFSCFSYGPRDVGNLISSSSVFSKSSLKIR